MSVSPNDELRLYLQAAFDGQPGNGQVDASGPSGHGRALPGAGPSHLCIGRLMAYDSQREAVVNGSFELWTTANGCAVVMDDGQGGERRGIVFEQPQVVWAFTCMTRLMQSQGHYKTAVDD